jgi:hypothetical protein
MTDGGQAGQQLHHPDEGEAPRPAPAVDRSARYTWANMVRSLLPLVVLCLAVVAWTSWQQRVDVRVQTVDPSSTVQLAAARAGYPVLAPAGLPEDYRVTSARTDAGRTEEGGSVTLEIGYLTPGGEYAGFVVSDDPGAGVVVEAVRDATEEGDVEIEGETWRRLSTGRGETAFVREGDGGSEEVTVLVTGSASDEELRIIAAAVETHAG